MEKIFFDGNNMQEVIDFVLALEPESVVWHLKRGFRVSTKDKDIDVEPSMMLVYEDGEFWIKEHEFGTVIPNEGFEYVKWDGKNLAEIQAFLMVCDIGAEIGKNGSLVIYEFDGEFEELATIEKNHFLVNYFGIPIWYSEKEFEENFSEEV